jgi:hypothetical protein
MKTVQLIIIGLLISFFNGISAQELPLILNKQGTFEILSRTDYVSSDCGFTKADITANLQRITDLVNIMRKNAVLAENKGFEGRARIYNISCKDPYAYGIPSRISFEFCSYFKNKEGKEVRNTIEPPEWTIIINKSTPTGDVFSSNRFNRESGFFTVPLKKETIIPGIDVYDSECYVVYDPNRVPYWIPVTVEEAFASVRENWKNYENKATAQEMLKMVEKEYAAIPIADRNKPAYFGGNMSRICASPDFAGEKNLFPKIMKVNPEYWNKSLPKSSIQFMYFTMIGNKTYLKNRTQEALKANSTSYHLRLFEESLDVNFVKSLLPIIK